MLGCNTGRSLWWLNIKKKRKTQAKFTANIYPAATEPAFSHFYQQNVFRKWHFAHFHLTCTLSLLTQSHKKLILCSRIHLLASKSNHSYLLSSIFLPGNTERNRKTEETFELSLHVHVMQLLAQILKDTYSSKVMQTSVPLLFLLYFHSFLWHASLVASVHDSHDYHRFPCIDFIVIFLLFVSHSNLNLSLCFSSCFTTEVDKRQIKALLPGFACLSRHTAPLCGSLSVCPGPDYSWQRHW